VLGLVLGSGPAENRASITAVDQGHGKSGMLVFRTSGLFLLSDTPPGGACTCEWK